MKTINVVEGDLQVKDGRVAIIVARFNSFIVDNLLSGAIDTLNRHGINNDRIDIVKVPGAFELPLVAKRLAGKEYAALIALGAVIRGGTPHFEYVAGECSKGLAQVSMEFEVPMAFGVLTCDTIEQAIERAGCKAGNKGSEAALSCIEMMSLFEKL